MTASSPYRVLARKYRPKTFADLIGQDALVRTLSNAISSGKIAQAYLLTGIRGIGKTTSARIIARALNCVGPDGDGGMTINPCGVCEHCVAIESDRHVDVLEIDAASNTSVDNVREIIEGTRYSPSSARFKIYIIDEVHMLSRQAFNALLKTLEEPPERVKFIFATTEIRKIPPTVLSRCQRFDLKRVDPETLSALFKKISDKEGIKIEAEALSLIAKVADGSVRDGLSILDQAGTQGTGPVTAKDVRAMIGLADRRQVFDLLESLMKGDVKTALSLLGGQYRSGADPLLIVQDLLDVVYTVTRIKVAPLLSDDPLYAEETRAKMKTMAAGLSVPVLTRAWQMLIKGVDEVRDSFSALQAAEMLLIRLCHASQLPPLKEIVKTLRDERENASSAPSPSPSGGSNIAGPAPMPSLSFMPPQSVSSAPVVGNTALKKEFCPCPDTLPDLVALLLAEGAPILAFSVKQYVSLVKLQKGQLDFYPLPGAPRDLAFQLSSFLTEKTETRWLVSLSSQKGGRTLQEESLILNERMSAHPLVKAVLTLFPGASVRSSEKPEEPAEKMEAPKEEDAPPSQEEEQEPEGKLE